MKQQQPQGRLWIRLIKKQKVLNSIMVPCSRDNPEEALRQALPPLDLSQPMWLSRHRTDWEEYALTRFKPEHFIDSVSFDMMEISYIYAEDEAKTARRRLPIEDA
ncbi:MAG: hypothetical protein E7319_08530 [Clostridiales bacterium]|nr:hypothetical protein [Clostridiales bacterium]